jgi:hypothetical protein
MIAHLTGHVELFMRTYIGFDKRLTLILHPAGHQAT